MIIVEGPDGGGKSNLVRYLSKHFDLPVHARASDSINGPVKNLFQWVIDDVSTQPEQPLSIYDRHPLISEYIYGPICRAKLPDGFTSTSAHAWIRHMAVRSLVVLCRPPNERLIASVAPERDMPGVTEHIERIAACYDAMRMFWPGRVVTYDFTAKPGEIGSMETLLPYCNLHISSEKKTRENRR